jgi:hypothetical protein
MVPRPLLKHQYMPGTYILENGLFNEYLQEKSPLSFGLNGDGKSVFVYIRIPGGREITTIRSLADSMRRGNGVWPAHLFDLMVMIHSLPVFQIECAEVRDG